MVESVQRRATKYILSNYSDNDEDRLKLCDLLPLCFRREIMDLTFMFNAFYNLNDLEINGVVTMIDNDHVRDPNAVNNIKLVSHYPRNELYFNWYFARIVGIWINLPPDVKLLDLSEDENNKCFKSVKGL